MEKSRAKRSAERFFAFKRSYLSFPYALFLVLFVFLPILIIVLYAFTETVYAADGTESLTFSSEISLSSILNLESTLSTLPSTAGLGCP